MSEALSIPQLGKFELLGLMLIWLITGMLGGPIAYLVVPVCILFMGNKRMHLALLIGFIFILTLSDSRIGSLAFTENLRPVYLIFLGGFIFFDSTLRPLDKTYKVFIPFLLVALLWLINSNTLVTSLSKTISYFLMLVAVPTYLNSIYKNYSDEALKYIVYFFILLLSVGLAFWLLRSGVVFLGGRYRGILGNPNGLGVYTMLFFLLFAIINTYRPFLFTKRKKVLFYVIIFVSLVLCGSRSALGSVLIFLFFRHFYKISKVVGAFILIIILISYQVIIAHIPDIIIALDLQKYARLDSLQGGSGRLIAIQFAWEHIKNHIWTGGGMGYSDQLFVQNAGYLSQLGHQGGTHNSYLTVWLDTGLIGLIFFVGAWLYSFWRASMKSYLAYPILLAILFSSFIEEWLASSLNAFTFILIMIITLLTNSNFINDSR